MVLDNTTQPLPAHPAEIDLEGRVVLLVGGVGGLGEAVAEAAAAAGAQLIVAGRQVVKLERLADRIEATGGAAPILYPVDLTGATAADYDQMAGAIRTECGRLDAVVHLAARFGGLTPLSQLGTKRWKESMAVNVDARFLIDQATLALLRESEGRIIHVVDRPEAVARAYWGAYGVSQVAQRGLLAVEADEYDGDGVTVVGFEPPPMRTRLRAAAFVSEELSGAAEPAIVAPDLLGLLDTTAELTPGACYGAS